MMDAVSKDSTFTAAIGAMRRGDFTAASETWERYREAFPEEAIGWIEGATALWKGGQGRAALTLIAVALDKFPHSEAVLSAAAQAAWAAGDWKQAELHWRQLLEKSPHASSARRGLCGSLAAQLRWGEAEACLRDGLEQSPDDLDLAISYATLATRQGAWTEAEERWKMLGNIRPGAQEAMVFGLVEVRLGQGRFDEASDLLTGLAPATVTAERRASRLAARLATAQGNWRLAEQLWAAEIQLNPNETSPWLERGAALTALGEHENAVNVLREAIQKRPHDGNLHRAIALNAMERREWGEAARYWTSARAAAPERLDSWIMIVQLRRLLGQHDIADIELEKAMSELVARTGYKVGADADLFCSSDSARERMAAAALPEVRAFNEKARLEAYTRLPLDWPQIPTIEIVDEALLIPQDGWRPRGRWTSKHPFQAFLGQTPPILNGGVYDSDGRIVRLALHYTGDRAYVPDTIAPVDDPTERLAGRWLYGGIALRHFGAFVVESLGRLWALRDRHQDIDGIVYICGDIEPSSGEEQFGRDVIEEWAGHALRAIAHGEVSKIYAKKKPIKVISCPTKVENLIVASQLGGRGRRSTSIISGHPLHRSYLRECIDKLSLDVSSDFQKIYVSRSRMPVENGFFFRESLFEDNLRHEGYRVIHPQEMTFLDQIRTYRSASHIILGSGSACHVLALAVSERQRVAVISRERNENPIFAAHIRGMGADVTEIHGWKGAFEPVGSGGQAKVPHLVHHRKVVVLDWDLVWGRLASAGFVRPVATDDGKATHSDAMVEITAQLKRQYGADFVFIAA